MKSWKVYALLLLALAAPISYFAFFSNRKPDPDRILAKRFARNSGLSAEEYYALKVIRNKLLDDQPISEDDWKRIEAESHSTAIDFRAGSLIGLSRLEKSPFRDRAHAVLRRLAHDPDPGTRCLALRQLAWTRDSEARSLLVEAAKSSDQYVRTHAQFMLQDLDKGQ